MNFDLNTIWFEISLVCGLFAFGSIFFGHFEEHTPKWRRVLKLILFNAVVVLITVYAGRAWTLGFLGISILAILYIHGYWLPRKKGINGLTGEPKQKYYEWRGWTRYLDQPEPGSGSEESET